VSVGWCLKRHRRRCAAMPDWRRSSRRSRCRRIRSIAISRSFVVSTSSNEVGPALLEQLVDELLKEPARVWREMFDELSHYDDTGELERITARTLPIWGDADGLVGHAMQTLLAERIAAELLVYPGCRAHPALGEPITLRCRRHLFRRATAPSRTLTPWARPELRRPNDGERPPRPRTGMAVASRQACGRCSRMHRSDDRVIRTASSAPLSLLLRVHRVVLPALPV